MTRRGRSSLDRGYASFDSSLAVPMLNIEIVKKLQNSSVEFANVNGLILTAH
jgi:hypothetical protein